MNILRYVLLLALVITSFVTIGVARAETQTVSFSPLAFIFDTGYLIEESRTALFPNSVALNYNSTRYPGTILAGSHRAVLTTFSEVPEEEHQALLDDVFCQTASSVLVVYGERDVYEVQLIHIQMNGEYLHFTTEAVGLVTQHRDCN